jgi:hypothetical protein
MMGLERERAELDVVGRNFQKRRVLKTLFFFTIRISKQVTGNAMRCGGM